MKFIGTIVAATFLTACFACSQDSDQSGAFPDPTDFSVDDLLGRQYSLDEFRSLYIAADGIVHGKFKQSAPFSKNGTGVSPQTFYQFDSGFKAYRGNYPSFSDNDQKWQVMVYDSDHEDATNLEKMEKDKNYIVFFPKEFDREKAVCFAASEELTKVLVTWSEIGVYDPRDIEKLQEAADWIVKATLRHEVCLESFPCQHSWEFQVEEKVKGDEVPDTITIQGRYRDHSNIPAPLKGLRGRYTLYLIANADTDTDVLASIPR